MARIVLGVTGSVAAIKTPRSFRVSALGHEVRDRGHRARSLFFRPGRRIDGPSAIATGRVLFRDRDEWPAPHYQRGDPVLHIEFRNWAELLDRRPARRQHAGQIRPRAMRQLPDMPVPRLGFFPARDPGSRHEHAHVAKPADLPPSRADFARSWGDRARCLRTSVSKMPPNTLPASPRKSSSSRPSRSDWPAAMWAWAPWPR